MKTIILCGGAGTRLKEETEFKPKPMVSVGGKPIIWHIMKIYASFGFNEFILALGYKADYVKDFFLNQKAFTSDFTLQTQNHKTIFYLKNRESIENFKITFVDTGVDTKIGERILKCRKYIDDSEKDFMVTYGDGVSDVNIKNLYKFHLKNKAIGTITAVHPKSKFGLVIPRQDGLVEKIIEKPHLNDWVNGGFMVFQTSFFKYLKPNEMEHPALNRIAAEKKLSMFQHKGFWFAVDTFKELEELNSMWSAGDTPWKSW